MTIGANLRGVPTLGDLQSGIEMATRMTTSDHERKSAEAEQTLEFDHPEVRVINAPVRFDSVGEKRNACAALASYGMPVPRP